MNWKYYRPKFEYEDVLDPLMTGWYGHVFFAYDFVRNMKPKRIVELGTHFGHSFFSFCQAAKDEGLKTELVAVDTWKGDEQSGFYDDSVFEGVEKVRESFYENLDIRLLRKTFDEALTDFKDESIDILHIDGLHTYEAVKHDFENWLGKVKKDGIIFFHDTAETKEDFGVYKVWDEIKKKYKTLEFDHSHGLGVMFKSPKHFKEIDLFKEVWRHYYTIFSENKLIKLEIDTFNKEIQKRDKEIKLLCVTERKKNQNLAELRNFLQQKDQKIVDLKNEIQQKNQAIRQKDVEIQQGDEATRQKDFEIETMKSSKFWKLRERYISIRNKINPRKNKK